MLQLLKRVKLYFDTFFEMNRNSINFDSILLRILIVFVNTNYIDNIDS